MKRSAILSLPPALALFAGFPFLSANAWEPLRAHPENPHILEFRGQPAVLRTYGEHYSSVINADFEFIPYLDSLQRDGLNLTRVFLVGFSDVWKKDGLGPLAPARDRFVQPWKRTDTHAKALDGHGKWDLSSWNEDYFARLKSFAQACGERGIVIELTLFCTQYSDAQWQLSPFHPANNVQGAGHANRYQSMRPVDAGLLAAQEAVVRKIVNEVNSFDNIYFEIQNEPFWNGPGVRDAEEVEFHHKMLAVIRDEESRLKKRHLVAHNFPQQAAALSSDFDIINEHYPAAVRGSDIAGAEALLRDHYSRGDILAFDETDTTNPTQNRLESWMFILGGGAIYSALDVPKHVYTVADETGNCDFGKAARGTLRDLGTYLKSLDLTHLRRDLSWITGGIPAGATLQAMASPGRQYVAYLHHGKSGGKEFQVSYDPIDSSKHHASPVVMMEKGKWRAVWTRPADLVELHVEEFTHGGGARTLAAATYQEDVALRIDRIGD